MSEDYQRLNKYEWVPNTSPCLWTTQFAWVSTCKKLSYWVSILKYISDVIYFKIAMLHIVHTAFLSYGSSSAHQNFKTNINNVHIIYHGCFALLNIVIAACK